MRSTRNFSLFLLANDNEPTISRKIFWLKFLFYPLKNVRWAGARGQRPGPEARRRHRRRERTGRGETGRRQAGARRGRGRPQHHQTGPHRSATTT